MYTYHEIIHYMSLLRMQYVCSSMCIYFMYCRSWREEEQLSISRLRKVHVYHRLYEPSQLLVYVYTLAHEPSQLRLPWYVCMYKKALRGRVESMQQSSATPKNKDVGRGLRKIVAWSQPYLAVLSCIYSFWHGVIPTSYFIFNDFYTCFTHFFPAIGMANGTRVPLV